MSEPSGVGYLRGLFSPAGTRRLTWSRPDVQGAAVPEAIYVYDVVTDTPLYKLEPHVDAVDLPEAMNGKTLTVKAEYGQGPLPPASPALPVYVVTPGELPGQDPVTGDVKWPLWFVWLSEVEKQHLLAQDWFVSWLSTTTTLVVKPQNVWPDNAGKVKEMVWRTDRRVLFHGDEEGRPLAEVFRYGLTPPEPTGTLVMRAGEHRGAFESFSYYFGTIKGYATPDSTGQRPCGYVYLVSTPGGGVCVDLSLLEGGANENEVAFPGGVAAACILGAFVFPLSPDTDTPPTGFYWSPSGALQRPDKGVYLIFAQPTDALTLTLRPEAGGEAITLREEPWLLTAAQGRYRADRLPQTPGGYYGWFVNGALQLDNDNGEPTPDLTITLPEAAMNGMLVIEWVDLTLRPGRRKTADPSAQESRDTDNH